MASLVGAGWGVGFVGVGFLVWSVAFVGGGGGGCLSGMVTGFGGGGRGALVSSGIRGGSRCCLVFGGLLCSEGGGLGWGVVCECCGAQLPGSDRLLEGAGACWSHAGCRLSDGGRAK